jgi:hypothetical protein
MLTLGVQKVRDLQLLQLITSATYYDLALSVIPRKDAMPSITQFGRAKEFREILHFLSFLFPEFPAKASAHRQALNIGTWSREEETCSSYYR